MNKIFISYAHENSDIACKYANFLKYYDWTVIIDKDFEGDSIPTEINNAIKESDCFLLLNSENAARSKWVKHEVDQYLVFKLSSEGNKKIIIIKLDSASILDVLKTYPYIDGKLFHVSIMELKKQLGIASESLDDKAIKELVRKHGSKGVKTFFDTLRAPIFFMKQDRYSVSWMNTSAKQFYRLNSGNGALQDITIYKLFERSKDYYPSTQLYQKHLENYERLYSLEKDHDVIRAYDNGVFSTAFFPPSQKPNIQFQSSPRIVSVYFDWQPELQHWVVLFHIAILGEPDFNNEDLKNYMEKIK